MPFINSFIEYKQDGPLQDENKKYEINEDLIFLSYRIYMRAIFKMLSIVFYILLIVYFVGQFWLIIVEIG